MGNFYTNFTLRGPSAQAVASALTGRVALVTPESQGSVVVYDQACDTQDTEEIAKLGARLSASLKCPVLAVLNHDDDILMYQLFVKGELLDHYDSCPGYFDPESGGESPVGGNAQAICEAFGGGDANEVESILRAEGGEDGFIFAVMRHEALAEALGLPGWSVGLGYNYAVGGELPEGLDPAELIHTA